MGGYNVARRSVVGILNGARRSVVGTGCILSHALLSSYTPKFLHYELRWLVDDKHRTDANNLGL